MKLDYSGWFAQQYLQISAPSRRPRTICQLGRLIVGMTALYLLLTSIAVAVLSMYGLTIWNLGVYFFTDATWDSIFPKESFSAIFAGFTLGMTIVVIAMLGIWGVREAWDKYQERKRAKRYAALHSGEPLPEPKPVPAIEFAKGLWARFHDKTCRMIEWENLKDRYGYEMTPDGRYVDDVDGYPG